MVEAFISDRLVDFINFRTLIVLIDYNLAYPNNISNNTFKNNIASLSGGAIKVLFNASELFQGETTLNKFEDCTDYKGLAVSDGKPLYFIFSFYDLLATVKEIPNVDYSQWITNSTLTVKKELIMFYLLFQ